MFWANFSELPQLDIFYSGHSTYLELYNFDPARLVHVKIPPEQTVHGRVSSLLLLGIVVVALQRNENGRFSTNTFCTSRVENTNVRGMKVAPRITWMIFCIKILKFVDLANWSYLPKEWFWSLKTSWILQIGGMDGFHKKERKCCSNLNFVDARSKI